MGVCWFPCTLHPQQLFHRILETRVPSAYLHNLSPIHIRYLPWISYQCMLPWQPHTCKHVNKSNACALLSSDTSVFLPGGFCHYLNYFSIPDSCGFLFFLLLNYLNLSRICRQYLRDKNVRFMCLLRSSFWLLSSLLELMKGTIY